MQAGNLDGCADAWIGRGLGKSAMVIGDAHAAKECNVAVHSEVIREMKLRESGVIRCRRLRDAVGHEAFVVDDQAELVFFVLIESVKACREVVRPDVGPKVGLCACVIRSLAPGCGHWEVSRRRIIVGFIEMIERRHFKEHFG